MQIEVEVRVPPMLQADALARHPQTVERELRRTLEGDVLILEGAAAERAPVNVGTLRGSIQSEVRGSGVTLTGRVWTPMLYGPPVEVGGRPHWAPLRAIQAWAARRIGGPSSNKVARAVWVAISKAGTKAQPFFGPAWKASRGVIEQRHVAMLRRIVTQIAGGA